jgi:hypothetical protein
LVTISKTRALIQRSDQLLARHMTKPASPAKAATSPFLKAELLHRIALRPDGTPFSDGAEDVEAAERVEPTTVSLGSLTLRVVDADPRALAVTLGAVDEEAQAGVCWLVEYDASAQTPCVGQYLAVQTGVAGVSLTFLVWLSHADLQELAASDEAPGAFRNPALQGIGPCQALLILEPAGEVE